MQIGEAIRGAVSGLIKPVTDLYANRQERLRQESEAKATYDRILVEASAADAKVAGQLATLRVQNEQSTWKDEYALLVISSPFVLNVLLGALEGLAFIPPGTTAAVSTAMFANMSAIPAWWSNTFQAGMLSALGVTLWNKTKGK